MTAHTLSTIVSPSDILALLIAFSIAYWYLRDGVQWWKPPLAAVLGFLGLLIVDMLGIFRSAVSVLQLSTVLMPVAFYVLKGVELYRAIVLRRERLNAALSEVRSFQPGFKSPINQLSLVSETHYYDTYANLMKAARVAKEQESDSRQEESKTLFLRLIQKHRETLIRKRAQSSFTDEYGRLQDSGWTQHAEYFISNVALPTIQEKGLPIGFSKGECIALLNAEITPEIAENQRTPLTLANVATGVDYELFVTDILKGAGWSVVMTPASGDHGADIIANRDLVRVAIQCKLYSSPVGNGSVQEVYSAKDFYECDFGIVVSNADYTKAARKAATNLKVHLVHHDTLISTMEKIASPRA